MKTRFKTFLKYAVFSGFFSAIAVASPIASPGTSTIYNGANSIASPGTSTIYNGANSILIYSPTVTSGNSVCNLATQSTYVKILTFLVDQDTPGTYVKTVDLSNFANCGNNTMLVIKAAGGEGNSFQGLIGDITVQGGTGGITTLKIPLTNFLQKYGTKVTFYYLVGGSGNLSGAATATGGYGGGGSAYGGGGSGGGESLVSLNNWPWNSGVPLAIGGGGGGSTTVTSPILDIADLMTFPGGGGGGGNDSGEVYEPCSSYASLGYYVYELYNGSPGSNGWLGSGGNGTFYGDGGGGAGYGGGSSGCAALYALLGVAANGGNGGGGYCNTSLGTCQASDWTNGGGNYGNGWVEIYIEINS